VTMARLSFVVPLCLLLKFSGVLAQTGCSKPLGLKDNAIPDRDITASSSLSVNHVPSRARLDYINHNQVGSGWSSGANNKHQWIQVNLGSNVKVSGIVMQGSGDRHDEWVKTYIVKYSMDGTVFTNVKGSSGTAKVFEGSHDRTTHVVGSFDSAVDARYIRIYPQTWNRRISMRFEVLGCRGNGKERVIGCQDTAPVKLACKSDRTIEIVQANYGRDRVDSKICPYGQEHTNKTNCVDPASLVKVKELCAGKVSCEVSPTNDVFGDPCPGNYKYLDIVYHCVKENLRQKDVACDGGEPLKLACEAGKVINIVEANYGRTQPDVCPSGYPDKDSLKCIGKGSFQKVNALCHGKQSCEISASTDVFGNPCVGVSKYLDVVYKCKDDIKRDVVIGCENRGLLELSCEAGTAIHIEDAFYGRNKDDSLVCPYGKNHKNVINCSAKGSFEKISSMCEGKSSCKINPTNRVFGDPCYGTYKYVEVTYKCKKAKDMNKDVAIGCENRGVMKLSCEAGKAIHIEDAFYGRNKDDSLVCPYGRKHKNVMSCSAKGSFGKVYAMCEGKQSCNINPTNSVFGDPCYGTYKYVEVAYKCTNATSKHKVLGCENKGAVSLACSGGKKIKIVTANYGRTEADTKICPYHKNHIHKTDCVSSSSLAKVIGICDGKESCVINPTNTVFGDPCYGTYKYLDITYKCKDF